MLLFYYYTSINFIDINVIIIIIIVIIIMVIKEVLESLGLSEGAAPSDGITITISPK